MSTEEKEFTAVVVATLVVKTKAKNLREAEQKIGDEMFGVVKKGYKVPGGMLDGGEQNGVRFDMEGAVSYVLRKHETENEESRKLRDLHARMWCPLEEIS